MKWKCTNSLLSVPVAAAVIGFGVNIATPVQGQVPDVLSNKAPTVVTLTPGDGPMKRATEMVGAAAGDVCGEMVTMNNEPKDLVFPNVPVCLADGGAGGIVETWIAHEFPAGALDNVCAIKFAIGGTAADAPIDVDIFVKNGATAGSTPGTMDVVCSGTVTIPAGTSLEFFTLNIGELCAPDPNQPTTIAWRALDNPDSFAFPGGNEAGGQSATYIASAGCGIPNYTTMAGIGFPQANIVFQVFDGDPVATPGACCPPKENGEDQECISSDSIECGNIGGIFHANMECEDVTCPTQVECPEPTTACPWDLNNDGVVNVVDLLILLENFGACPDPPADCPWDFNNDGVVNVVDLLTQLQNFGACPEGDGGPGDVIDEDEPCGERLNDGCNIDPPAFDQISCGTTVCGTAWTALDDGVNTRDTDWYEFTIDTKQRVTWTVHAEFPAVAILAKVIGDCEDTVVITSAAADPKIEFSIESCLQPGTYIAFVAPAVFEGLPCEGEALWGDSYTATLKCADDPTCPKGACCFPLDNTCEDNYDPVECALDGGNYEGDDTTCDDPAVCPIGACCLNDGECVIASAESCYVNGGAFQGDADSCAGIDCRDCATGDLIFEDEVCDEEAEDTLNGGCNVEPPVFEQVCCGDTIVGEVWALGGTRDLDWRIFTLKQPQVVNLSFDHNFGEVAASPCPGPIPGSCEGLCGDENPADGCFCDAACFEFGDCCEDVCEECPGLVPPDEPLDGVLFLAQLGDGSCDNLSFVVDPEVGPSPLEIQTTLNAGTYIVIVSVASFDGLPCDAPNDANEYTLSAICSDLPCEGECGNDFVPFEGDFCSCVPEECFEFGDCCPGVCPVCDPEGNTPDCAAADSGCGDANAGDCCEANGTPFCEDEACCEAVCAVDPFCCDVEWDADCAAFASDPANCGTLCPPDFDECGPGAGDCCVANGTPGCEDEDCCNLICAQDPFCCNVSWDGICSADANAQCAVCQ